jgi:hypothetical protein
VQHLALFVPWQAFLCETSGEINSIWDRKRARLPKRVSWLVDNVQLLRRSAEDVAQDAKQWAALSGELEPVIDAAESGSAERDHAQSAAYQSGTVGTATRLIDVMRNAISANEITAGSKEIFAMVEQMYRFQAAALESGDDLYSTVFPEAEARTVGILGGAISGAETPGQEQLRSIKAQQAGLSREREKAIQGMQSRSNSRGREDGSTAEGDCTWPSRDFHQFRPVQERSILLPSSTIPWVEDHGFGPESDITVVTPLNRNRWNLNMEATLAFQGKWQVPLRIFVSEHKWKDGEPTEEEALMMLGHGDDSAIPVPAVFMFVPGMPVVVNQNTHQGLKLVNGAAYTAIDVVPDRGRPGYRINKNTILHFGPPAGIVLASETTRNFRFVGMPPGTILLTPIGTKIECQRKRPWQQHDVSRRGLPCAAAFACTDYKVQARTLDRVVLELRGTRTTNVGGQAVPSTCDPYSLYVQLSRCRSLDGIMLLSKARERDFVGNTVPEEMRRLSRGWNSRVKRQLG